MFGNRPANHKASRVTILVAAGVALIVAGLLVYLAAVAPRGVPTVGYYDIDARFRDTADLKLLSSVTVNGHRVGQVSKITSDGEVAHLNLQMDPGTELLSDTTARIRVKNPVGAKYVDLAPGQGGEPLADNGAIPISQTSTAVDTPDLLSAFDKDARENLQKGLVGLGRGFLGRGQEINETYPKAPPLLENSGSVSAAILAIDGAAARFFPSAETLAAAYDPVREELATGFDPEATVFEAFADSRPALEDTLSLAPPFLTELRRGLDETTPFLTELTGFSRATSRLTVPLPGALREATALLRTGGPSLRSTDPLVDAIGDAVNPTIGVLNTFRPEIDPTIRALKNQMRPLIQLALQQCDVLRQASNWRSALSWGVPINTDPASELDYGQPGLGNNNNSFRVLAVTPTTEALLADQITELPPGIQERAYALPCTAVQDIVR